MHRLFRRNAAVALLFVWSVGSLVAAEPVRSGLQPGDMLPGAFEPLNVTGEYAGRPHCLVCENGLNPVVMIFARDVSDPLVRLLRDVDAATAKHRAQELGSFVVFLSEADGLDTRLADVARKQNIRHLILSIDAPAGPEDYKLTPDAEVTVVLYHKHKVQANHAFRKGELDAKAVERVLADLPKILPEK